MSPILLHFGGVAWPSFHLCMLAGYLGGALLAVGLAPRLGQKRQKMLGICLLLGLAGTAGAKLGHLLLEAPGHVLPDGSLSTGLVDLLRADPWHGLRLLDGGYVWYGGLLLGLLALWMVTRRGGADFAVRADLLAPGLAWGIAVGRLGCWLAGCCHGRPTRLPIGVEFPAGPAAGLGPVLPVQPVDSAFGLLLLGLLLWRLPRRRFDGELALLALASYAAVRFALEFARGDVERGLLLDGAVSSSQLISLVILAPALYMLARGWRAAQARPSGSQALASAAEASKP